MPTQINVNDLTFTIPELTDDADMPALFEQHVQGMPQYTTVSNRLSRVEQEVTDADINKIFDFNGADAEEPVDSTLTIATGNYWKQDEDGNDYGFQFGVATKNDLVTITTGEEGVSILPYNAVPPNSLAIITRISATTWLVVGGVTTEGPFILNKSLLNPADATSGDYYVESK